MSNEIKVEYQLIGPDTHKLVFNSKAMPDITIDYTGIPMEERGGTSVELLTASALYCFAATLNSSLVARKADVKSLTAKATAVKEKDEVFRTKISSIEMDVNVGLEDKDIPILKKCEKIMERGCLVTYTLEEAIEIEHTINPIS